MCIDLVLEGCNAGNFKDPVAESVINGGIFKKDLIFFLGFFQDFELLIVS